MRLIFLIGMPGAGKSYWGRIWARAHDFKYADLDNLVEAAAGVAIPYIFQSIGESGFRTLEAAALLDAIAEARERDMIIATGGGTPAFDSNMDTMLRTGYVVYLNARTETLRRQISASETVRPLLQGAGIGNAALEELLQARKPFYERAHLTLAVEELHTGTFAQILEACTDRPS
jgi:shikimate kinase